MTTLTEFLLARITEDEEAARASIPTGGRRAGKTFWQRRVVECVAKRRIVEHVEPDPLALSPGDEYVLRLLAQVYADHPDYDPTWKEPA